MGAITSRRTFLRGLSAATLTAGAAAGCVTAMGGETRGAGVDEPWPTSNVDPAQCRTTERNLEGPFHRIGAPGRTLLAPVDEPGERLFIRGRVLAADCTKTLSGALLDVWQANALGRYDNDDPAHPPADNVFHLRGQLLTDENGNYSYETIMPGRYLNGPQYRPAHIHYTVSRPGYRSLTTQLYFAGDPYIPVDPFVRPSLVIQLGRTDVVDPEPRPTWYGTFDIVLRLA